VGWCLAGPLAQFTKESWRSAFWLIAGLSALSFAIAVVAIEKDSVEKHDDSSIDWIGAVLITAGLVLLLFVLSQGQIAQKGWSTPYIIALLIVSVLLITAFVAWEYHYDHHLGHWPLMRLGLWTRGKGKLAATLALVFCEWAAFISWTVWIALYFQDVLGLSLVLTMVRLLPMIVTGVLLNIFASVFVATIPMIYLVVVGTAATGGAALLFALFDPHASFWAMSFPAAVLSVFGADFVFVTGILLIARLAHENEQSVAGALFQTVGQLGTALGLAITTVAQRNWGYPGAFWCCFAFAMLAMLIGVVFMRGVGVIGVHKAEDSNQPTAEKAPVSQELSVIPVGRVESV